MATEQSNVVADGPRRDGVPPFPLEIWKMIITNFANSVGDVTNFRCTCKAFTELGLPFALREITIYAHRRHLDHLRAIAKDHVRSKYVKSLVFIPWDIDMRKPIPADNDDKGGGVFDEEFFADTVDEPNPIYKFFNGLDDIKTASLPGAEHMTQDLVSRSLADIIPKLSSLKKVAVEIQLQGLQYGRKYAVHAITNNPNRPWHLDQNDFKNGGRPRVPHYSARRWLCFRGGLLGPPRDLWPMEAVLGAFQQGAAGDGPTSLKVAGLDWTFLQKLPSLPLLPQLINLTHLDLDLDLVMGESVSERRKCGEELRKGHLCNFLASLPNLEHLSISFPLYGYEFDPYKTYPDDVTLEDVIKPGHLWPSLKYLSLTGMASKRKDFLNVFELHKKTLERLELMTIFLIGDTVEDYCWTPFLDELREMLGGKNGCTVVIYGDMVDWEPALDGGSTEFPGMAEPVPFFPVWYDMGVPWGQHVGRENLTRWFAKGGECPVNQTTGFHW